MKYINKIEGWMTISELSWLYHRAKGMKLIVEIGSWKGRSTHALLTACKGIVIAIDNFQNNEINKCPECGREESTYRSFIKNVGHFKNLRLLQMDSAEAAKIVGQAEMVFIDGSHKYEAVKKDIELWLPKTTKIICGHDFQQAGVKQAVTEKFGKVKVQTSIWYKEL